jgi:hypothetical protein
VCGLDAPLFELMGGAAFSGGAVPALLNATLVVFNKPPAARCVTLSMDAARMSLCPQAGGRPAGGHHGAGAQAGPAALGRVALQLQRRTLRAAWFARMMARPNAASQERLLLLHRSTADPHCPDTWGPLRVWAAAMQGALSACDARGFQQTHPRVHEKPKAAALRLLRKLKQKVEGERRPQRSTLAAC